VASLPSGAVTPNTTAVSTPSAPTAVGANIGPGSLSVNFRIPTSDGGSPIIAYKIAVVGGPTITVSGRTVLVLSGTHKYYGIVQGLTSGKAYTINVSAVNVAGSGTVTTITTTPT
jgi:hypothetical protein